MSKVTISQELSNKLVALLAALPQDDTSAIGANDSLDSNSAGLPSVSKTLEQLQDAITASQESPDLGPWHYGVTKEETRRRVYLESDDFEHDVRLYLDGNFGSVEAMLVYASSLGQLLNAISKTIQVARKENQFMTLSKSSSDTK